GEQERSRAMQKKGTISHHGYTATEILTDGAGPVEADTSLQHLAHSVSLHLKGQREEALKALEGVETDDRETLSEVNAARGHIQFELSRYEDALVSYSRLSETRPNDPEVRFSLGLCYQHLGRYNEALENFRSALNLGAKRVETQLAIGACLLHLNRH